MFAIRAKKAKVELAELRDALRALAKDGDLGVGDPRSVERAALSDALLRVAGIVNDVQSLHDYYASLACRVAALEGEKFACSPASFASSAFGKRFMARIGELMEGHSQELSSLLAPVRSIFARLSKLLGSPAAQLNQLLKERDILLRRIQELERPGALSSSARRGSEASLAFPPEVFCEIKDPQIVVVDVGAQNLESEDHIYAPLMRAGTAKVIGFEPLDDEAAKRGESEPSTVLMNYFIGRGGPATFHITKFNPTSSLFEPDAEFLRRFWSLAEICETVRTELVSTTRLDDVVEIEDCDFLKIDVQGGEADVLEGAARLLAGVVAIQSEVEFAPLYKGQPLFAEIDILLRKAGFDLIDLVGPGYNIYSALRRPLSRSRLLWADAIYFKAPERLRGVQSEKLLKAAYIAHVNYGMYDLAADYLKHYDAREGGELADAYNRALCGE